MSWLILFVSPLVVAQQSQVSDLINTDTKSGKTYASFGLAFNEFRSVELVLVDTETGNFVDARFPETAQTYGLFGTLGTYISQYVKTELRFGTGIKDDTIERALDVNIHYWFAWYMGGTYPITDYMNGYGLYGVSLYDADVTRREVRWTVNRGGASVPETFTAIPSRTQMEEDLFGTKFSTSWLLGLDFKLAPQWYLATEYGRLLRDTDSNIKVYQGNLHLRYEF
ncbi:MAG: outer membrane beta-barrel protein [Oleiphilaceae bacterium]|nr:outer membrane beta-barrel protein [Oleiphilaceae bacterium]